MLFMDFNKVVFVGFEAGLFSLVKVDSCFL